MTQYRCQIGVFFALILFFLIGCDKLSLTNDENETENETISGFVQKGPFIKGSSLAIQVLDESLSPTGKTYNTQILNNNGEFSISINTMDSLFEFTTQGFYFNEITNSLSQNNLTLRAIAKIDEERNININTLTYIINERVRYLLNQEELTFNGAKKQAESELLANFHIPINILNGFEELDISQPDENNAVLLAISSSLLGSRTTAEFTELLANIASDMLEDGTIDDSKLITEINRESKMMNYIQIKNNLRAWYKSLGVNVTIPDLDKYCDRDGDGILNFEDNDFTMITRVDSNRNVSMIDETDWNYNGEYQVGDTITPFSSSTTVPTTYQLLPPFPNPVTLHDTLTFYWQLPDITYLQFYAFNAQGDTIEFVNATLNSGYYKFNIATIQFQLGYYEVFFNFKGSTINGTILFEEE